MLLAFTQHSGQQRRRRMGGIALQYGQAQCQRLVGLACLGQLLGSVEIAASLAARRFRIRRFRLGGALCRDRGRQGLELGMDGKQVGLAAPVHAHLVEVGIIARLVDFHGMGAGGDLQQLQRGSAARAPVQGYRRAGGLGANAHQHGTDILCRRFSPRALHPPLVPELLLLHPFQQRQDEEHDAHQHRRAEYPLNRRLTFFSGKFCSGKKDARVGIDVGGESGVFHKRRIGALVFSPRFFSGSDIPGFVRIFSIRPAWQGRGRSARLRSRLCRISRLFIDKLLQVVVEFPHVLVSAGGVLDHGLQHHLLHLLGYIRIQFFRRGGDFVDVLE